MAGIHGDLVFGNYGFAATDSVFKGSIVAELKNEASISDTWFFLSCKELVEKPVVLIFFWIFINELNHLDNSMGLVHDLIAQVLSSDLADFLYVLIVNVINFSFSFIFFIYVRDSFE